MEGLPSSIGYANNSTQLNQESSSSKLPTSDRRRIESGGIPNPTQTLDQFHQFPVQPNPDPDPDPAQLATADASNSKIPLPAPQPQPQPQPEANNAIRYRECLKNHAASIGGNVVDGCGEFMPSGEEGTAEALKCAACECHRNFHRKETGGGGEYSQQFMTNYYYAHNPNENKAIRSTTNHHIQPPPSHHQQHLQHHQFFHHYSPSLASPAMGPMMMAFGGAGRGAAESSSEDLNMYQYNAGGATQHMVVPPSFSVSKKRFRTKFSKEQKDRMHEVAEKLGWKIQKQDDEEVQQLCDELGIKRPVFKVWMHNNKQAMKKQHDE